MSTILEMIVNIDCPGCERKVKKALRNLEGVESVDIDMDLQKVTVTGLAEQEKILKTVRKTGKKADLWPSPSNTPEYTSTEYFSEHYNYHSDPSSYFSSDYPFTNRSYDHRSEYGNTYSNVQQVQQYEYISGHSNYNNNCREYGHQQPLSSSILVGRSTTMFSDENVNACSIM